jgi:hypothetical protein
MPSRLSRDPHEPGWYFEQTALAMRIFPLDRNLWRVPMELLGAFPADRLPAGLSEQVLADVRRRDPQYFLFRNLDSL